MDPPVFWERPAASSLASASGYSAPAKPPAGFLFHPPNRDNGGVGRVAWTPEAKKRRAPGDTTPEAATPVGGGAHSAVGGAAPSPGGGDAGDDNGGSGGGGSSVNPSRRRPRPGGTPGVVASLIPATGLESAPAPIADASLRGQALHAELVRHRASDDFTAIGLRSPAQRQQRGQGAGAPASASSAFASSSGGGGGPERYMPKVAPSTLSERECIQQFGISYHEIVTKLVRCRECTRSSHTGVPRPVR